MASCYDDQNRKIFNFKFDSKYVKEINDSLDTILLYYEDCEVSDKLEDIAFDVAEEIGIVIPNLENIETIIVINHNIFNLVVNIYPLVDFENEDLLSEECKNNIRNFYLYKNIRKSNSRIYHLDFTDVEYKDVKQLINY